MFYATLQGVTNKLLGFGNIRVAWEGKTKSSIERITSLFENEVLEAFFAVHMVIDSVLVLVFETCPNCSDMSGYSNWSFCRKINIAEARDLIHSEMA